MIAPNHAQVVAADPTEQPNASLVIAAARAGHVGLFDIGSFDRLDELASISDTSTGQVWVRPLRGVEATAITRLPTIVTAVVIPWVHSQENGQPALSTWRSVGIPTIVQVVSIEEARAAVTAGADGLLASGSEAGGRVGDTEAFILFQQCVRLAVPVWVRCGIGLHTAPAIIAGGGSGDVAGRFWIPWFQPQHQNLISIGNLRNALEERGFTVIDSELGPAHQAIDLAGAAFLFTQMIAPKRARRWLPEPTTAARIGWVATWVVGLPIAALGAVIDQILATQGHRADERSNTYRVLARRDG